MTDETRTRIESIGADPNQFVMREGPCALFTEGNQAVYRCLDCGEILTTTEWNQEYMDNNHLAHLAWMSQMADEHDCRNA